MTPGLPRKILGVHLPIMTFISVICGSRVFVFIFHVFHGGYIEAIANIGVDYYQCFSYR